MSIFSQNQCYADVIPVNTKANAVSIPVFMADFKTAQFTIVTNATANFNIEVLKSNQENPPVPTSASYQNNQWVSIQYVDESNGVDYSPTSLYNPGSTAVTKVFNVETEGARWIFIKISTYVAGALLKCDVELLSNNT